MGKSSKQINGCDLREMSGGRWQMGRKSSRYCDVHTASVVNIIVNIFVTIIVICHSFLFNLLLVISLSTRAGKATATVIYTLLLWSTS